MSQTYYQPTINNYAQTPTTASAASYYHNMQQRRQMANVQPYVEAMVRKIELRKHGTIWYAPNKSPEWVGNQLVQPRTVYVCNEDRYGNPDFASPALSVDKLRAGQELKQKLGATASATELDEANYNPFYPEWVDDAVAFNDSRQGKTAGAITSQDFTSIQQIVLTGALVNQEERTFVLQNALTQQATANISIIIDTYHRFTIGEEYKEMDQVEARQGSFTRATFKLSKTVGHVSFQDDFFMDTRYHDVKAIHLANMNSDFTRVKVKKIGAVLLTADAVTGTDWSTMTGEHNTNNPLIDFEKAVRAVDANYGTINTVASNTRTYQYFDVNSWTKDKGTGPVVGPNENPRTVGAIPGLGGATWYLDNSLPDTKVLAFDKSATLMLQGPTKSAQYRDEHHEISGYYTRDYHRPIITETGKVRQITGVCPAWS